MKKPTKHEFRIKRVYDEPAAADGLRFLVDRLWPRGIKKEALKLDGWLREVAPSSALRKWFNHDPDKWAEFQRRYLAELKDNPAWKPLLAAVQKKNVTLLFAARDARINQASVLRDFLNHNLSQ
jgi:uncharacterized protein YeaO (DUF488 family)